MNFNTRIKKFKNICNLTKSKNYSDLVAWGKISKNDLTYLQETSKLLLYSCLVEDNKKLNLKCNFPHVINQLLLKKPINITHNGLVVPKKENSLEYNLFLKSFLSLIKNKGFDKIIDYFISPPQLRIKFGLIKNKINLNASEHIHSDAWTNYNTDKSLTFYLPIYGDTSKNFVEFFRPKNIFDDSWLCPRKFKYGAKIEKQYKSIKTKYKVGEYILTDCATLHRSILLKNSKPRISIDAAFIPKGHFGRKIMNSHIEFDKLKTIGSTKLFIFKHSFKDKLKKIKKINKQSLQNRYFYNY